MLMTVAFNPYNVQKYILLHTKKMLYVKYVSSVFFVSIGCLYSHSASIYSNALSKRIEHSSQTLLALYQNQNVFNIAIQEEEKNKSRRKCLKYHQIKQTLL